MSVSTTAPTPTYSDSERLVPALPSERAGVSAEETGSGTGDTSDTHLSMFAEGDDSPSFWDLLDVINPLQHIPVVNTLYREMTGDKIGVGAQIAGGALLGGIVGVLASGLNCVVQEASGKDVGEHVVAMFRDDGGTVSGTAVAGTSPSQKKEGVAAAGKSLGSSPSATVSSTAADEPPVPLAAPQEPVVGTDLPTSPSTPAQGAAQVAFNADGTTAVLTSAVAASTATAVAATGSAPRLPSKLTKGNSASTTSAAVKAGKGHAAPERTNIEPKEVATISVPQSHNGSRSNVPATGHRPAAASSTASTSAAVTAQKIAAAQSSEEEASAHPMVPSEAANQTAAAPDWFTSSMMQALDKYERAAKSKTGVTSSVETVQ